MAGGENVNNLEKSFLVAFDDFYYEIENSFNKNGELPKDDLPIPDKPLEPGMIIGPYKVDFLYGNCVIELDGYDFHKTKEQRDHDYKRERYLQKRGYIVIRFTGTEVFLEARKCVIDMVYISNLHEQKLIDAYFKGAE